MNMILLELDSQSNTVKGRVKYFIEYENNAIFIVKKYFTNNTSRVDMKRRIMNIDNDNELLHIIERINEIKEDYSKIKVTSYADNQATIIALFYIMLLRNKITDMKKIINDEKFTMTREETGNKKMIKNDKNYKNRVIIMTKLAFTMLNKTIEYK